MMIWLYAQCQRCLAVISGRSFSCVGTGAAPTISSSSSSAGGSGGLLGGVSIWTLSSSDACLVMLPEIESADWSINKLLNNLTFFIFLIINKTFSYRADFQCATKTGFLYIDRPMSPLESYEARLPRLVRTFGNNINLLHMYKLKYQRY